MVPSGTTTNCFRTIRKLSTGCSQRCSQRALVLKTTRLQASDLRLCVGREGLEPPTPCASFISVQSDYQRFCGNPQVRWSQWFRLVMVVSGWFAVSCAPGAPLRAAASSSARGCAEAPRYRLLISAVGGALLFGGGVLEGGSRDTKSFCWFPSTGSTTDLSRAAPYHPRGSVTAASTTS